MSCSHLEPVDPRVKRTRKLLQDALRDLSREKEFASISIQDITERATVNRATFYAHYPDKQALLGSLVQAEFQDFVAPHFTEFSEMDSESLTAMTTLIVEFVGRLLSGCPKTAKEMGRVVDAALHDEVVGMFGAWLECKEHHPFKAHKNEMVATVLASSILGAAYRWGHGEHKRNPKAVAKAVVALLLPGVPVAAGRA